MESKNNDTKKFKEQLISDMINILNAEISDISKKHIIDMYCWLLTERKELPEGKGENDDQAVDKNAKYKGCDYWTEDAFKQCFEEKDNILTFKGNKTLSGLRHEHVVPRKLFVDYVNSNVNNIDVDKINNSFIGCVVTKEESEEIDKKCKDKMPKCENFESINDSNLWSRYTESGITSIYEIEWEINNKSWTINKATLKELKK